MEAFDKKTEGMYTGNMRKQKGFTVIETVLVLAIAGLIFGLVFLALPAMQGNQRDTQRRESILTFVRNLKSYQTNNSRGALPGNPAEVKDLDKPSYNIITVDGDSIPGEREKSQADKKSTETTWMGFYRDYFNDGFQDPNGYYYNLAIMMCKQDTIGKECTDNKDEVQKLSTLYDGSFSDNEYYIRVVESAVCDGDKAVKSANQRRVAVLYRLERSGVYCENT